MSLSAAFGLPPEEALAWFQAKGYAITWGWRDMDAAAHARAFTVAGVTKLDVLADIRGELTRTMQEGTTLADFKKRLIPRLQTKGWWGKQAQTDMDTGEMRGKGLTPRRLETIFRANVQSAYMAGRWKQQIEDANNRPWWQYVAILDGRTRPQHAALNGRIFRYDDPFWRSHYPPNGFNCRCPAPRGCGTRRPPCPTAPGAVRSSSKGAAASRSSPARKPGRMPAASTCATWAPICACHRPA